MKSSWDSPKYAHVLARVRTILYPSVANYVINVILLYYDDGDGIDSRVDWQMEKWSTEKSSVVLELYKTSIYQHRTVYCIIIFLLLFMCT